MLERLKKVALHEIGHNLGFEHCTNNKECMMNDANATIKQVDREKIWFCSKCMELIGKNN
jgi:archaemetzincin